MSVPEAEARRHTNCGGGLCEQYGVLCDGCAEADPNAGIAWQTTGHDEPEVTS